MERPQGKRICVIGSGISGLSTAWLLHRNRASVILMEKEEQCGGHTLTDHTSLYPVDVGFQVFNLTTYPHFVGFLDCLGVDSMESNISFALSIGRLDWDSDNLDTIFAQRRNLRDPSFLAMLKDVVRFGREAPKVLEPSVAHIYSEMTLSQYLKKHNYSTAFVNNYMCRCAQLFGVFLTRRYVRQDNKFLECFALARCFTRLNGVLMAYGMQGGTCPLHFIFNSETAYAFALGHPIVTCTATRNPRRAFVHGGP
ncbi:hypothetical protein VaNZ11_010396 [Volvox africanus]|uniref:Amine oxidase domain-containing protein n=1 Tax=Volvox africanus TaxID=51714 RepID=A0ABQ5S9J8_9CHLO|nr:hypothetical protein VaNZ11_010396 [Volvox africanus]